jgi:hypothetical protein
MSDIYNKEEYNKIPVCYCENCLSLKIRTLGDTDLAYCDNCGSTEVLQCDIENWKTLYKNKYNKEY